MIGTFGHEVRLIAPQFVKPYVRGQKNDMRDAAAICDAASHPEMRFVPQKSIQQQDMQMLHRMRSGLPGEAWFIVWGLQVGNSAAPITVRLYAFDGATVRTVWGRTNLSGGDISVANDTVILNYERESNSPDPDNLVHLVLHVTANGLE